MPYKAKPEGVTRRREKRYHGHAVPEKVQYEVRFPRVEGYTQAIRNHVTVDWSRVPSLVLQPDRIPPDVEMKGLSVNNVGRQSLSGPHPITHAGLPQFPPNRSLQMLS